VRGATRVGIDGEKFALNGVPTYPGRSYRDRSIEGLLLNARVVQAIFDDLNPATRGRWAYPDTGAWDPERNVGEFLDQLPIWRRSGLLGLTVNLQGGSPEGYSREQPWHNSAFEAHGSLRPDYLGCLARVLDRSDKLGYVVILGLFYQGQDERLADERAVVRAVDNAVEWVLGRGCTNVVLEVNNECDVPGYEHEILRPHRVHELIRRVRGIASGGRRLLVGTSYRGGSIPDDHFDFDRPWNNMLAAISRYASWGFFDAGPGSGGAGARGNYIDGYQNVPL
jgi:hypothetical protein